MNRSPLLPLLFLILASLTASVASAIGKPIVSRNAPTSPVYTVQPAQQASTDPQANLNARYRDTGISTHSTPGHKPKPLPRIQR